MLKSIGSGSGSWKLVLTVPVLGILYLTVPVQVTVLEFLNQSVPVLLQNPPNRSVPVPAPIPTRNTHSVWTRSWFHTVQHLGH